jgi:peptidoglycan hydrolase-like protein with peptidoglycan-binding domain
MSKEQATQQEAQQDGAAPDAVATEQTYGLPPHVYGPLMKMGPADSEALHDLLVLYPGFRQQILSAAVASHHMGNIAIQRAMEMTNRHVVRPGALTQQQIRPGGEFELEGNTPGPSVVRPGALTQQQIRPGGEFELEGNTPGPSVVRPGALTQQQIRPGGEFELEGNTPGPSVVRPGALTQEQIRPGGEFELEGNTPAKPAVVRPGALTQQQIRPGGEFELEGNTPAPKSKAEPPWVAGARAYNDAHASLVAEFNDLTGFRCAPDDGLIDPQGVAAWQRQHGLDPDGKVGPHTLAAARQVMAKAGGAGAQADARIPV